MPTKPFRVLVITEMLLGIAFLFVPLVFMQQHGPCGDAWPNPDDIMIYGAFITGKRYYDIIMYPANFQIAIIISCIGMVALTLGSKRSGGFKLALQAVVLVLLLFFPLWFSGYITVVYGNSDGCSLTTHYQWGLALYPVIVLLHVITILQSFWLVFRRKTI